MTTIILSVRGRDCPDRLQDKKRRRLQQNGVAINKKPGSAETGGSDWAAAALRSSWPCVRLGPSGCPSLLSKFDKSRGPGALRPERLPPFPPRALLSQEPIPPTPGPARKLTFDLPGFALLSPGHLGCGRCRWGSRGVRGPCYGSPGCRRRCRWPGSGRRRPDSRCSERAGSRRWAPLGASDPRLEMSKRMRRREKGAECDREEIINYYSCSGKQYRTKN